jgi:hypothetical protein
MFEELFMNKNYLNSDLKSDKARIPRRLTIHNH